MARFSRHVGFLVATTMCIGVEASLAQQSRPSAADTVSTYGTLYETAYTVPAVEFTVFRSTDTWGTVAGTPNRYLTSADGCCFEAGLHLPSGAVITKIQIEACDASPTAQVLASLNSASSPAGSTAGVGGVGTGIAETPGCVAFTNPVSVSPGPPVVVANGTDKYWVEISSSAIDGSTSVAAIRVFYLLSVSPAPATATFNDVPITDPAFQYIEALAAAGITHGCGGLSYCPDSPVTRRQLAVFLATALGLHFTDAQ